MNCEITCRYMTIIKSGEWLESLFVVVLHIMFNMPPLTKHNMHLDFILWMHDKD